MFELHSFWQLPRRAAANIFQETGDGLGQAECTVGFSSLGSLSVKVRQKQLSMATAKAAVSCPNV